MPSTQRRALILLLLAALTAGGLIFAGTWVGLHRAGLLRRPIDPLRSTAPTAVAGPIQLAHPELREISGLAPHAGTDGIFWALSDGGAPAVLLAIDTVGQVRQRVEVAGATNIDWEALTAGPCGEQRCLYIGDIGDNRSRRRFVTLYRLVEPEAGATVSDARRLDVQWPAGPDDIEAMTADVDGTLWFVTKGRDWGRLRLFRLAAETWTASSCVASVATPCPQGVVTAVDAGRLALPTGYNGELITDAALAPDGALILRSYDDVLRLPRAAAGTWTVSGGARCRLEGLQRQGEGLAHLPDGRLVLASEGGRGTPAALHLVHCPPA